METMLQDIRFGFRILFKSPAFTLVAALSLALGIGANTAVFSIINASLLKPLPVEEPERLVSVFTTDTKNPGNLPTSHLNYVDYRDQNQVFSSLLAYTGAGLSLTRGETIEPVFGLVVSGNYFDVLGVKTALGRAFLPDEDKTPGAHPVVVLSHGLWQRGFGGDVNLVGKTISLNRHDFTVVGIVPEGFTGTDLGPGPDLWVPMMMHDQVQPGFDWYNERRGLFLNLVGRLKPGVSVEQAQASLKIFSGQLAQSFPKDNEGRGAKIVPLLQARIDPDGSGQLLLASGVMMGVVALVLLIACANIANLLLARASARRKEIAMRLALGAGRARLIRQLLTESLVLSLVGGVVGFLVALWARDLLRTFDPVGGGPNAPPIATLNFRVLGFTLLVSLLSGVIFGLAPALQASKPDLVLTLKGETSAPARRAFGFNLRKALVVIQVALSLVSLISAGLFVRSLRNAQATNPGFITDNILLAGFNLGREGMDKPQGVNFQRQLAERAAALPGVQAVTIASSRPFDGGIMRSVFLEGQAPTPNGRGVLVQLNNVGLRFFETLGISLQQGRDFSERDDENAPKVVIINETMARRFWPNQDAIGKRFKFFGEEFYREVVGVARDTKYNDLTEANTPFIYAPLLQNYSNEGTLHVRTTGDATRITAAVRAVAKELAANVSLLNVQTLGARIDQSLDGPRAQTRLLAFFGLLALLLSSIGIYGVMAYSVAQRTREIGIRMALGARSQNVLSMVVGQGMTLVGGGVALGLIAAFAVTRLIGSLLFGVGAADPVTFVIASLLLVGVAALASYLPARRATKVDPLIALRHD
jgi:macrolide transport system ATP-binding/permease protein